MRNRSKFLFSTVFFVLFLTISFYSLQQNQHKYYILFINSYHFGYPWSDSEMKGAEDKFSEVLKNYEIFYEFMDSKRTLDGTHLNLFYQQILNKYKKIKFDCILVSDNDALKFIHDYHNGFYPSVPVVFCGINDFSDKLVSGLTNITGVLENNDYKGTVDLALLLMPKTRNIVVISDGTTTGIAHEKAVRNIVSGYTNRTLFQFYNLSGHTIGEAAEMIRKLNDDSIVLILSHFRDKTGQSFSQKESLPLLTENSKVPFFTVTDTRIGYGVLGGKVTSGYYQGHAAAEIALDVLSGRQARQIPFMNRTSPNKIILDDQILRKFHVQRNFLPKDAIIINQKFSAYEKYKNLIWLTFTVIILLVTIIALLWTNITRRMRIERDLINSENKFSKAFLTNPDAININRLKDGLYLEVNQGFTRMTGYSAEETIGKTSLDIDIWANKDDRQRMIEQLTKEGQAQMESEFRMKDGSIRVGLLSAALIDINQETCIISITRDINERKKSEEQIKASLIEKETLLKEIHHRVKNNLQIISSLLRLQENFIKDPQVLSIFRDSQNRVKSMAMIHERLYQSKNLSLVDMKTYIDGLIRNLVHSYNIRTNAIEVKSEVDEIQFEIDTALTCGLLLNEILSNCFKHAFTDLPGGTISIHFHRTGDNYEILIKDNGIGLPDNFDLKSSQTLGMQLVNGWIQQLDGTLSLNSRRRKDHPDEEGFTEFKISFPGPL